MVHLAKKDDGEKAATADTDPEKEGEDSGQPKAEGSEKFTNDPKVPAKEEKGGSTVEKVKVAESKCEKCGEPTVPHKACASCGTYKGKPVFRYWQKIKRAQRNKGKK